MYSSADLKDNTTFEIIKFTRLNKLDLGLKIVYRLTKLIATIPSTKIFSTLKIIKIYCRSIQGQNRLFISRILSIEKKY